MRIVVTGDIYITLNIRSYNSILVAFLWLNAWNEFSIHFNLMSLSLQKKGSHRKDTDLKMKLHYKNTFMKTMNFL